ncbi:MAG: RluA family pseudouridine synthase [Candidatus Krumholzibacteriota bacterium]|nr:RluA family pseudouridine synthase [Candidatus Krumholzibacteriota bacterium]
MNNEKEYISIVDEEASGDRLDVFLSAQIPELSRSRIQKAVRSGEVLVNGDPALKVSRKVSENDEIMLRFKAPKPSEVSAEDIPLDIVYEDGDLLVVNKKAGMVVHPAPGNAAGTMVNALLAHCTDLSGIGGVLRPGIVHRLDALTTGLLVVAKNDRVHIELSRQLMERKVRRIYFAIIWGEMPENEGLIDLPIGRSKSDRKKMAVVRSGGRPAVTYYNALDTFGPFQYIRVKLGTGRTHQIRVHLSHAGHPVLGDPVYGGRKVRRGSLSKEDMESGHRALTLIDRQALHAGELSFFHPSRKEMVSFTAPLPDDFSSVITSCGGNL